MRPAARDGVLGVSPTQIRSACLLCWLAVFASLQTSCRSLDANLKPGRDVVVTLAGLGYDTASHLPHEGLDRFTRETGIKVDIIPSWGNSTDQLAITRRTLDKHLPNPDVYLIDAVWTGTLANHLRDLPPLRSGNAAQHLIELLRNDTVDGRLVALPFYLNVGMLYYRADLLKKYGYKHPPETWDQMEQMATQIQKGERSAGRQKFWGYVFQGAPYEGLTCNALEWQRSFGGGHIIEPDGTISVNNAHTAAALRKAAAWVGSISPSSVLSYTESDSLNAFRSGNAAFMRYWSSGYNSIANSEAMRGRCEVGILPRGSRRRAQTMGGFHLAVSAYSQHASEAMQLVRYLTGDYVQKERAVQEGYLPTLPNLYNDAAVLKAVPEALELRSVGLDSWISRPSTVAGNQYAAVSAIYYRGVHAILSHHQQAPDALGLMEKQILALGSILSISPA